MAFIFQDFGKVVLAKSKNKRSIQPINGIKKFASCWKMYRITRSPTPRIKLALSAERCKEDVKATRCLQMLGLTVWRQKCPCCDVRMQQVLERLQDQLPVALHQRSGQRIHGRCSPFFTFLEFSILANVGFELLAFFDLAPCRTH